MGWAFKQKLADHNIQWKLVTAQNPQANGIVERMHQVIANVLRIIMQTTHVADYDPASNIMDNALATCMHVHQCAVNRTLMTFPKALVYGRDMFLDVPVIADLMTIQQCRQEIINQNLVRQNRKQYDYHY